MNIVTSAFIAVVAVTSLCICAHMHLCKYALLINSPIKFKNFILLCMLDKLFLFRYFRGN